MDFDRVQQAGLLHSFKSVLWNVWSGFYFFFSTVILTLHTIFLSLLMILLVIFNVIKLLIWRNRLAWLLKFNLTVRASNWIRRGLVSFTAGKIWLVLFYCSDNSGVININIDGTVLNEKSYFKCWNCLPFLNYVGIFT